MLAEFGKKDWRGIKKCAAQNGRHSTGRGVNPCIASVNTTSGTPKGVTPTINQSKGNRD